MPFPIRSVQRMAKTCQGKRASARSGRTVPAIAYPTTVSGRSRRARSAHRPETYLNRFAVASAAPSMIPSVCALPPIATRKAGSKGTTISLETLYTARAGATPPPAAPKLRVLEAPDLKRA